MFVIQEKTVGKLVFFVSNMNVMALFYDIKSLIFFFFFYFFFLLQFLKKMCGKFGYMILICGAYVGYCLFVNWA